MKPTRELLGQDKSEFNVWFVPVQLDDAGLTPPQFRVYAHLARRSNKGRAWPGIDSISEVCSLNRTTVIDAIRELEKFGMIEVRRETGKGNIYILTKHSSWLIPNVQTDQSDIPTSRKRGTKPVGNRERKVIQEGSPNLSRPRSESEVINFTKSLGLPDSDGEYFWSHWQGNGFSNNKKAMKNWEATIRSWKLAGHCPSQKNFRDDKKTHKTSAINSSNSNRKASGHY